VLKNGNPETFKQVMDFPWAEPVLILTGEHTNLIRHFAQTHNATYLTTLDVKIRPKSLYIFENVDAFFKQNEQCAADVFSMPMASESEKQFFSFLEHLKSVHSFLLLTATTPPKQWAVFLDDLRSRFKTMPVIS
ncbi:MAG: hypothetical protein JXQ74_00710, partial [Alphaproteobacteria bacterium]|nr:hypothetical protein [Alphaproteobacteria bacterium]